jgi:hypothetical protein
MDPSIYRAARSEEAGIVLASAAVLFTVRVVLEQTIVTWVRGVESTGYFPPQSVLDWIGLCCVILALVWAIAVLLLSLSAGARVSAGNRARMIQNSGMAELVRVRLAEPGPGRPESSAARN